MGLKKTRKLLNRYKLVLARKSIWNSLQALEIFSRLLKRSAFSIKKLKELVIGHVCDV
jgi:hypothetical protein